MLRYAIVLQVALVATAASSAPDTQPTTIDKMSTVDAIKACRAELGRHGRYSQVRKCVSQKRMSTVDAINACRADLEHVPPELNSVGFPGRSGWQILSALIRFWERERCRRPTLLIFEVE